MKNRQKRWITGSGETGYNKNRVYKKGGGNIKIDKMQK